MIDRCYDQKDLVALYDLINSGGPDWIIILRWPPGLSEPKKHRPACWTPDAALARWRLRWRAWAPRSPGLIRLRRCLRWPRARAGAALVHWQHGTLQSFHSDQRYDLIYMTGHAFHACWRMMISLQAFLAVAAVLAPGRQFVFETRNPACAPWQNWVPARSEIALVTADDVAVRLWHQLVEITDDYVHL